MKEMMATQDATPVLICPVAASRKVKGQLQSQNNVQRITVAKGRGRVELQCRYLSQVPKRMFKKVSNVLMRRTLKKKAVAAFLPLQ